MTSSGAPKISAWLTTALVAVLAWAAVMVLFHRVSWSDWSQPPWLEGDPLEVYARVKLASEQPGHALLSFTHPTRLGAPIGADWSAYPVPDKLVFVLTGLLARITGLIAAVQLAGAFFVVLNALSFYWTARWLRWRWEWAAALALVFALSSYNIRWGVTLSFAQTFTLPPLVLICARAARRNPAGAPGRAWSVLAALLGLWLGLGNPYLAYFAGVVGGGALALALLRRCPRSRQAPLAVFLGILTLTFLAANASYAWQYARESGDRALVRGMGDFTVYALRPADWFVPPADHRLEFMARLGRSYRAFNHGNGEFFYNYLGVLGIIGLFALLVVGVRSLGRKHTSYFDVPLGLGWITLFGIAGGVNTWIAAAGLDLFRAGTRIGVFAGLWALLFLCGRMSRITHSLPRLVSLALAAVTASLACWEETPPLSAHSNREKNVARWARYQTLTETLEQALPPAAAVFQLPAVAFPEAGHTGAMTDYEHFLPYLTSHTLRFSYGTLRNWPAMRWTRYVSRQPPREMIAALAQAGFSALWIDERAYADHAARLEEDLRALGLPEFSVPDGLMVRVFRLTPAAPPELPDLNDPRLRDPWDDRPETAGQPRLLALKGWYGLEKDNSRHWRWARQKASTGVWWDGAPTRARLSFKTDGRPHTRVSLQLNGTEVWRSLDTAGPTQPQQVDITLQSGLNTLEWKLEGRTFRPGGNDQRQLGFMIENLAVSVP